MQRITFQRQSEILCADTYTHTDMQLHVTYILILFLHKRGLALMQTFINLLYSIFL